MGRRLRCRRRSCGGRRGSFWGGMGSASLENRRSCRSGRRQRSSVRSGSRESKAPTRMRFSAAALSMRVRRCGIVRGNGWERHGQECDPRSRRASRSRVAAEGARPRTSRVGRTHQRTAREPERTTREWRGQTRDGHPRFAARRQDRSVRRPIPRPHRHLCRAMGERPRGALWLPARLRQRVGERHVRQEEDALLRLPEPRVPTA
jgi:hypothetical protein